MERMTESIVPKTVTNILLMPWNILSIRFFSAPNQPSATSDITPITIGIILVVIAEKVANKKLCKLPMATCKGLNLERMIVNPMLIVAANPIIKDWASGIKSFNAPLSTPKTLAKLFTKNASVPPSLSVNIVVISKPTLPSLFSATTSPPA